MVIETDQTGASQMTNQEIRNGFNQMIQAAAVAGNQDAVAKFELAREYFTNEAFKNGLQDHVWAITQAGA
jgi:hypothetical protein